MTTAAPAKKKPKPKPKVRRLRIAIAPMQFSDPTAQTAADAVKIFNRDYNVILGTEVGPGSNSSEVLKAAAKAAGYKVSLTGRYDTWVAVQKELILPGTWKTGAEHAIDRSSMHKPTPPGRWGDKAVVWAQFEAEGLGVLSFGAVHPLTFGGAGRELKKKTDDEHAEVVAKWVKEHGKGKQLAFPGGDWNLADRTNDLTQGKWKGVSCWEDVNRFDNTGHGNIDAILRSVNDTRVLKFISARALDDKELPLFNDHFLTEVVVEIEELAA